MNITAKSRKERTSQVKGKMRKGMIVAKAGLENGGKSPAKGKKKTSLVLR